jgi:trigger factor
VNVTVENLAPCKKLLRIELDAPAVDAAFEEMTGRFQRAVTLPGFRPGKAPRAMVAQRHAEDIQAEVKRKLISDAYQKAVKEQNLPVVGYPDIEEIQFQRGRALQFAATVETAPEFELPEYKGLPVKREAAAVTEADLQRALDTLREQRVTFRDVARPVQSGDYVVVNYRGTCEGRPITELAPTARGLTEQKNFWMHIQPGQFIPGFTEQLIGMAAGEKRVVNVAFPADFVAPQVAGKPGAYEVEIVHVKERVLPALDDEFAKSFGAENLEKLREGVRADLQRELDYKQTRAVRNQIVGALLERVQFDLPESVVAAETRSVIYDLVRENQQRGVPREAIEQQKEQIYNFAAGSAKERVKAQFLLGRIAQKENIQVDQQELAQRIYFLAMQNQMPVQKFAKLLEERGGYGEVRDQILTAKVLDFLEKEAKIEEVPAGTLSAAAAAANPPAAGAPEA